MKNFVKQEKTLLRGINVTSYKARKKFDLFGLKDIDLDLILKTEEAGRLKFTPIQTKVSFIHNDEKFNFIFDYFDFKPFNELSTHPYRLISYPSACYRSIDIESPIFRLSDIMEIEFVDISSNDLMVRSKFFIDRKRKLVRLENDAGSKILDMKNRILFKTDTNGKCEIEQYSSNEKLKEIKRVLYKNVHLILNIGRIGSSYTFVGATLEDGYSKRKFQNVTEFGNLYQKKTLYYDQNFKESSFPV